MERMLLSFPWGKKDSCVQASLKIALKMNAIAY